MHSSDRSSIYWSFIESQLPRLIAQLDRNPLSKTYGSFDRKYWHQRFTDFSSASLQQGVETLAFIYQFNQPGNPYFQSTLVLSWVEAAITYTHSLQNKDGSFDEWYVGEHGWAGPTSYIINSLYQSYIYCGSLWQNKTLEAFRTICRRAVPFIGQYEESHVLANHQAIALLSLKQCQHILDCKQAEAHFDQLLERLKQSFDRKEGWSIEYDGADPGYQTATLSFLARIDLIERNDTIRSWVSEQITFVSYFAFPGGQFCEGLGSRSTANVFFFAFEYWGQQIEAARRLAEHVTTGLQERTVIAPQDQEDHYLIYRLPELVLAMEHSKKTAFKKKSVSALPYEESGFFIHYKNSGHFFIKKDSIYMVIDSSFGGRFRAYNTANNKLVEACGDEFSMSSGHVFTTGSGQSKVIINNTDIEIKTHLSCYKQKIFNPLSLIAFKMLFSLLSRAPKLALLLKSIIRSQLMYNPVQKKLVVTKKISLLQKEIHIETQWPKGHKGWRSSSQASRYVPQSMYFTIDDLLVKPLGEDLQNLNSKVVIKCVE